MMSVGALYGNIPDGVKMRLGRDTMVAGCLGILEATIGREVRRHADFSGLWNYNP